MGVATEVPGGSPEARWNGADHVGVRQPKHALPCAIVQGVRSGGGDACLHRLDASVDVADAPAFVVVRWLLVAVWALSWSHEPTARLKYLFMGRDDKSRGEDSRMPEHVHSSDFTKRLQSHQDDFTWVTRKPFSLFFCPILHKDEESVRCLPFHGQCECLIWGS
jgi:hypothetical protein